MAVVGDRAQGQAEHSSIPSAILKSLWKWTSYQKGDRIMEICQVSASAQAIVSCGGIQVWFKDLKGLTQLHTH